MMIVLVLAALGVYIKFRYKIPKANQALVITGAGKEMKVLPGRGAFVTPRRSHEFFPLGTMTVRSDDQETQSSTLVPVVVQWTAQIRADVETDGALLKAVRGFSGYKVDEIKDSLKQTLDGEVRAVVAKMTPEEVVRDKDGFSTQVSRGVSQRMTELGFELISLNIAEVTDHNEYYNNASAEDREGQRKRAETLTAQANKEVAVAQADADEKSKAAEQQRDLALAEQQRDLQLRRSAIQVETDHAAADAAVAGQLRTEERNQELAARRGEVQVIEEQQRNATASARREVELTDAETNRQRTVIDAQASKERDEINAAAEAREQEIAAEAEATVATRRATGEADAAVAKANGDAEAMKRTAEAEAEKVRKTGMANADVARAQGEAEATAILARGDAEATAQLKMAEALASHEGANLRITLAEIERDTRVTVSTNLGQVMATMGENATFIDMGGSGSAGNGSDILSRVLGNVPELLAKLDVTSGALHGAPFGAMFGSTVKEMLGQGGNTSEEVDAPTAPSVPISDNDDSMVDNPLIDDQDDSAEE